jgi:hypothetical protein
MRIDPLGSARVWTFCPSGGQRRVAALTAERRWQGLPKGADYLTAPHAAEEISLRFSQLLAAEPG